MPRRRVGLCRPAFVCSLFYLFGSWSYGRQRLVVYNWKTAPMYAPDGPPAGTSTDGVQLLKLVASCTGSTPARRPVLAGKQTGHITGPYAACMQRGSTAHTARKKCEQRARGGATTAQRRAHRREGVGGAFLSFYALQTSSGTTLHARNFFQKSQLYRLRI